MLMSKPLLDSDGLARQVRELAGEIHRLTAGPPPSRHTLAAVAGRVRQLRVELDALPPTTLHRWAENLQRRVESLTAADVA